MAHAGDNPNKNGDSELTSSGKKIKFSKDVIEKKEEKQNMEIVPSSLKPLNNNAMNKLITTPSSSIAKENLPYFEEIMKSLQNVTQHSRTSFFTTWLSKYFKESEKYPEFLRYTAEVIRKLPSDERFEALLNVVDSSTTKQQIHNFPYFIDIVRLTPKKQREQMLSLWAEIFDNLSVYSANEFVKIFSEVPVSDCEETMRLAVQFYTFYSNNEENSKKLQFLSRIKRAAKSSARKKTPVVVGGEDSKGVL